MIFAHVNNSIDNIDRKRVMILGEIDFTTVMCMSIIYLLILSVEVNVFADSEAERERTER